MRALLDSVSLFLDLLSDVLSISFYIFLYLSISFYIFLYLSISFYCFDPSCNPFHHRVDQLVE